MSPVFVMRSSATAARTLGDETMVMSTSTSTLFTLDEVASVIWAAADGTTPLSEIVEQKICSQYEVGLDVALKDAQVVVEELAQHGLLLVSPEPIRQSASGAELP